MRRVIKKFLHQTQGAIAIEVALILPVLIAIIVTCLALYDGFRHYTMTTRASNVLADSISRIEAVLTPEDIEGLLNVFRYMTHQETGTSLRCRRGLRTKLKRATVQSLPRPKWLSPVVAVLVPKRTLP